jgi:CO dehydrogenase maturation factor
VKLSLAVSGKGGVGKTTFTSLLVKYLKERRKGTVLAIDADPNTNLHLSLGVEIKNTLGQMREDLLVQIRNLPVGVNKLELIKYQIHTLLSENERVDLLAMGRPEGRGCYCFVNEVLRSCLDALSEKYTYLVMDNEAGMEHLSRRTTRNVDILFVLSDHTPKGIDTARRITQLAEKLETKIKNCYLVINRVQKEVAPLIQKKVEEASLELIGFLREDKEILFLEQNNQPLFSLKEKSFLWQDFVRIMEELGI